MACLVALSFLPLFAYGLHCAGMLPDALENVLFFLPQLVFHWYGILAWENPVFYECGGCGLLCICEWAAISCAFGRLMKGRDRRLVFPAAFCTIVLTTVSTHVLLSVLGVSFRLDGP